MASGRRTTMSQHTGTSRLSTVERTQCGVTPTTATGQRHSDAAARESASHYLSNLVGAREADLSWDLTFSLQGHARVGPCELIVIASRDRQHKTVVLTVDDWDLVRHNGNCAALVAEHAIVTPQQLDALIDRPHV
jgi:hypothetical protein